VVDGVFSVNEHNRDKLEVIKTACRSASLILIICSPTKIAFINKRIIIGNQLLLLSESLNTTTKKTTVSATIAVLIAVLMLSNISHTVQAQTPTAFISTNEFPIPTQNSTITFALDGTYSAAILENGTWTFKDITFDNPKVPFFDLTGIKSVGNLEISARDCNITIWIYLNVHYTYPIVLVSYFSQGTGTQTVNLGLNNTQPTSSSEWSVVVNENVFLAEGQGWKLLPDDSLVITPPNAGNITVMHFDFNDPEVQKNLPFWMQHFVLLLIGVVLAVTAGVAVLIRIRLSRQMPKRY
jgi:hypothetical protein